MGREKMFINDGWKFHLGDIVSIRNRWAWGKSGSWNQGPEGKAFNDGDWQDITLPHDFVIATTPKPYMEKEFGDDNAIPAMENVNNIHTTAGSFKKDVGWYRKRFYIPEVDEGRRLFIVFDGIYRDSSVYLNEFFVGAERSGYKRIVYDITDFVNYGGENIVSVRVDARQAEGWFYEGGGIYRQAYILKMERAYINEAFIWSDVNLRNNSARVELEGEAIGCEKATIYSSVFGEEGEVVSRCASLVKDGKFYAHFDLDDVSFWDPDKPSLYTAYINLELNDVNVDYLIIRFGVRDIRFSAEKGLILNGKQIKVKGVCCHQNHGGLGAAVPDEVHRYRVKLLKEMGVNAYRSHYPLTSAFLEICDEEGMLVMQENRLLSSEKGDLDQLECMVKRSRNHPCVFMYSIGNEEAQSQATPQGARIAGSMIKHIKKFDKHTPVTMALLMWDLKNKVPISENSVLSGISEKLDVAGFNYQHIRWEAFHEEYPFQPFICTEQGTFRSTRSCYETDIEQCHLSIIDKTADSYMKGAELWRVCRPDWVSGLFIWTGFDYYGEPTPYAWPAISSQFGAMDLCGFPKDFYYYYKSWWTDSDVLHVFPHWNWNEGDVKDIYVFSNCDEVELFVNGVSLGRKALETDGYLVWEGIPFEAGELLGIGYRNGVKCIDKKIETTGEPSAVRLVEDYHEDEIRILRAEIVDGKGRVIPTADSDIVFEAENGVILGTANGNPSDHSAPNGNERKAFNGLAQVIVKTEGQSVVRAKSIGLEGSEI